MRGKVVWTLCAGALLGLTVFLWTGLSAESQVSASETPDLTGVYYPFNPGGRGRGAAPAAPTNTPPPPPTRTAPTSDGSQGRGPNAPRLTPEYMEQWEIIRDSRISGSYEYDNIANCLPPGMPAMMGMAYGMEVMQNENRITFFSEWQDAMRRVYLDGRQPSERVSERPHIRRLLHRTLGRGHARRRNGVAQRQLLHRRFVAAQRRDDGDRTHPVHRHGYPRGPHYGLRPGCPRRTLGDYTHLPKSVASQRRTSRVCLRRRTAGLSAIATFLAGFRREEMDPAL